MQRVTALGSAALAASALLGLPARAPADLIIDAFESPAGGQIVLDTATNGSAAVSVVSGESVAGGVREIFADKFGPVGTITPVTASSNQFDAGLFSFDQFGSSVQGSARLVYDGTANGALSPTGLATGGVGVDLTQGGLNTGLLFTGLEVVGSGLTLTANLYNAVTGQSFSSGVISLVNGFSGDLFLPYSSFSGAGGVLTPGNAGAIEVLAAGTQPGSDLTFDLVSSAASPAAAPEPSSLMLLGLAGGAAGVVRWRRRKADVAI